MVKYEQDVTKRQAHQKDLSTFAENIARRK